MKICCCLLWHHKDTGLSWGPWWNEDQELTAHCPHFGSPVGTADEMTWNLLNCTYVKRCGALHRGHVNIEPLAHLPSSPMFLNLTKHLFPFTFGPVMNTCNLTSVGPVWALPTSALSLTCVSTYWEWKEIWLTNVQELQFKSSEEQQWMWCVAIFSRPTLRIQTDLKAQWVTV